MEIIMLPQDIERPVAESVPLKPIDYDTFGNRSKTLLLWFLITLVLPIAQIVMLVQALLGSGQRAHEQAVAYDQAGNTIFGGSATQTMSSRVGDAKVRGQKWAQIAAPVLDFFFGKGHALSNVDLPVNEISAANQAAVNQADAEQGEDDTYATK
jgi:hypothetical protein